MSRGATSFFYRVDGPGHKEYKSSLGAQREQSSKAWKLARDADFRLGLRFRG